ncbi:MAG: fibronectin type III domain-containing protein, partial [Bdellovibrionales bacterium]|nr:fibronectin type III domain-containing protein [Bdellovibrionales bacterium]
MVNRNSFILCCIAWLVALTSPAVCVAAVPTEPFGLQAADGSDPDHVFVSWGASIGATTYELYRSQFQGAVGEPIATLSAPITTFIDTGAVPGVRYYYRARGVNNEGASPLSNSDAGYRFSSAPAPDVDGDGADDAYELALGTNPYDPGSVYRRLTSPASARVNTFLNQISFLELSSASP